MSLFFGYVVTKGGGRGGSVSPPPDPSTIPVPYSLSNAKYDVAGNSILFGHQTTNGGPPAQMELLEPLASNGSNVVNAAVSGLTTTNLIDRFNRYILPLFDPTVTNFLVFNEPHNAIINEVGKNATDHWADVVTYYNMGNAAGFHVIYVTTFPMRDTPNGDIFPSGLTRLQAVQMFADVAAIAMTGVDIPLDHIAPAHLLTEFSDPDDTTYFNADGEHITDAGNIVLAQCIVDTAVALTPVISVVAPTLITAYTFDPHTLYFKFDKAVWGDIIIKQNGVTITPDTDSGGRIRKLGFSETFAFGDVIEYSFAAGDLVDRDGNGIASSGGLQPVTNVIPDPSLFVLFDQFSDASIVAGNNGTIATSPPTYVHAQSSTDTLSPGQFLQWRSGPTVTQNFVGLTLLANTVDTINPFGYVGFYCDGLFTHPISGGTFVVNLDYAYELPNQYYQLRYNTNGDMMLHYSEDGITYDDGLLLQGSETATYNIRIIHSSSGTVKDVLVDNL